MAYTFTKIVILKITSSIKPGYLFSIPSGDSGQVRVKKKKEKKGKKMTHDSFLNFTYYNLFFNLWQNL